MMKNNSVDLGAKLLASENVTIVRARVSTASFDIKSRVLTLPQWKDMSPVVEEMLVCHEVGHALYTTEDYIEPLIEFPKLKSYMNIIEDVRIEKLIKRKYPGIRKIMTEGYKQLNDKDFFGVSEIQDLTQLNTIDKINLYFKAGFACGVTFNDEEQEFVHRAEKTESIADVVQLSKDVYEYSREKIKQELLEFPMDEFSFGDDTDFGDDTEQSDDTYDAEDGGYTGASDGTEDNYGKCSEQSIYAPETLSEEDIAERLEEKLESITEETFSSKLEEMTDQSISYHYHMLDETEIYNPIVGYKQILIETRHIDESVSRFNIERVAKFKVESNRVVSYLLKEFEMRKSAQLYKRAQTSKVGSLDMKKIWSYKLNEDLFKRMTNIPEGKNHGMIFLLDWSGSMDSVLEDTLEQVISLAMFCHRGQIPYQVFAFTSSYAINGTTEKMQKIYDCNSAYRQRTDVNILSNNFGNMALLEFFSSKMSTVEFNTMTRRLMDRSKFHKTNGYSTGGTPLNEALAYMVGHIPKFIQSFNVEKMSFITLTDGQGSSLSSSGVNIAKRLEYSGNSSVRMRHLLSDPVTKRNYEFSDDSSVQTQAILKLIKDRYNVNSVGFYICRNSMRDLRYAVQHNVPNTNQYTDSIIDSMRVNFRKDGFASLPNSGRDDLFIIPQDKMNVDDVELNVDANQTARTIAKNFGKTLTSRRTSRVLLNRFIGYVS